MSTQTLQEQPTATGRLVVISGPSGAGKSSVVQGGVLERTGATFSVSATTRSPRAGEQHGREYLFVDRAAFENLVARGEMLEWAEVFGQWYGTPAGPVRKALAEGRTVVLEIDVQGGRQVFRAMPDALGILIVPPSVDELARRLRGRGSETPESFARRLGQAREELESARQSGLYTYEVVNDDLATAVDRVVEIINRESHQA